MTVTAKVVFPPPPPTTNSLSYQQRTQLMRTTKKLGRVLGYAPHLVDNGSTTALAPLPQDWSDDEDEYYRPVSRGSTQSSSTVSSGSVYSSGASIGTSSRHSRSSSTLYSNRSTMSSISFNTEDSWSSYDTKPPLLRLALSSSFRSSPRASRLSPTSSDFSEEEDSRFTLRPVVDKNPRDSLISPKFLIPSTATLRLQKMDRLRRKLGDGVPVELVFPDTDDDEITFARPVSRTPTVIHVRSSVDNVHVSSTPLPPLPPTPPSRRPTKTRSTGINGARDSIVSSSAHRGHRVRRKPVPKLEPTRLAPPPPVDADKHEGRPLSLILENPQEQDDKPRRQPISPTSEWFSEGDGIEQWVDYLKMTQQ